MVIVALCVDDKGWMSEFFEETFLLADIGMDVAFEIFFLTFSNAEINLVDQELSWRLYTTGEALPTTIAGGVNWLKGICSCGAWPR